MVDGIIKHRLFAGLLLVASCHDKSFPHDTTGVANGLLSTALHVTEAALHRAVGHDARNRRRIESAASAIFWGEKAVASDDEHPVQMDDASKRIQRARGRKTRRRLHQRQQHLARNRQTNGAVRSLIVGGAAAPPGRFPYAVSLQLEKVLDESSSAATGGGDGEDAVSDVHTCGGTLIAMDVVLTAGHCGYEELPSSSSSSSSSQFGDIDNGQHGSIDPEGNVNFGEIPQQIFYGADVGAYNISKGVSEAECDNMLFERLVIHPEYTGFHGKGNSRISLQHDVMLVKLYGASDQSVVRIHNPDLADSNFVHRAPAAGEDLVVVGWGDTDPALGKEGSDLASILQAATVAYVSNDICEDSKGYSNIQSSATKFEDYFEYDGTISDDMMCALGESRQDACQGDSGGPLMRLGDDFGGDEDVQMGIVSWGLQCGDEDFPGVYARVGEHYEWIAKNVCKLSDSPPGYFNCPPKPYPPGSPYDPVVELTITIRFDDYRSETGWVLESIPDFRNVVYRPFGTYESTDSVDENNAMSETVPVHSGRFYMLSILDEFADGFCCTVGEGYFRVDSTLEGHPIVETTPGILWSPHALRRAFYVSPPDWDSVPDYVTVVVTLGAGADPGKFLLVALENVMYEALMLYAIRPFVIVTDSRAGSGTMLYSQTFRVPVLGAEFNRQRYNIMVYDDNQGEAFKASFEVYLGDARPENLILAQSGNYGDKDNISRSFILFKKQKGVVPPSKPPAFDRPAGFDGKNGAASTSDSGIASFLIYLLAMASMTLLFSPSQWNPEYNVQEMYIYHA